MKKFIQILLLQIFLFSFLYATDFETILGKATTKRGYGEFSDSGKCSLYLKLDVLVDSLDLTRWQALKLQKNMAHKIIKDGLLDSLECDDPGRVEIFKNSYNYVKNKIESEGFPQIANSSNHNFVIAFDLDNTMLLEEKKKNNDKCDIFFVDSKAYGRCVTFSPFDRQRKLKSPEIIKELKKLKNCLGVIFYTAKEDFLTDETLEKWVLDGKPIEKHLLGYLSKYDMIKKDDYAGYIPDDIKVFLKKDLTLINQLTDKIIIVDDNIKRLFQWGNVREIPPFEKENFDTYPDVLKEVYNEIVESNNYLDKSDSQNLKNFSDAYFPYTKLGLIISERIKTFGCIKDSQMTSFLRTNKQMLVTAANKGLNELKKNEICSQN